MSGFKKYSLDLTGERIGRKKARTFFLVGRYGLKIAHSNDKYRKLFWRCNGYYKNQCHAPNIYDKKMREGIKTALQRWIKNNYSVKVLQDIKKFIGNDLYYKLESLINNECPLSIDTESIRILVKEVEVGASKQLKLCLLNNDEEFYQL